MKIIIAIILCVLAYSQVKCQDVAIKPRILNGDPLQETEPVRTAAFISYDSRVVCSGAIIHPRWLLTSARCAAKIKNNRVRVVFGKFVKADYNKASSIKKTIIYPAFELSTGANDIALVELYSLIETEYYALAVPDYPISCQEKELVVMGYGENFTGWNFGELTKRCVKLASKEWCKSKTNLMNNQICSPKSIACQGDLGSPLILDNENLLIGLVSMMEEDTLFCGYDCVVPLTTYVNVSPYKFWIEGTIAGLDVGISSISTSTTLLMNRK